MRRIDAYTLFSLGVALHKVDQIDYIGISGGTKRSHAAYLYLLAHAALEAFLTEPHFKLKSSAASASDLKNRLASVIEHCREAGKTDEMIDYSVGSPVQSALSAFDSNLKAELSVAELFAVDQKSAFDTQTIIWSGELAFPRDLLSKCPEAAEDVRSAMRCLAFDLYTAAAFHLHRAHELLLRRYWDTITQGQTRPTNNSLGAYISGLEKITPTPTSVLSALRDVKNLHRNPVVHADQSLRSADEAIDLQCVVRYSMGAMLKAIPTALQENKVVSQSARAGRGLAVALLGAQSPLT